MKKILALLKLMSNEIKSKLTVMTGATASTNGKQGFVPAPAKGNQGKYLRGDGTWQTPPDTNTTYGNMTAATSSAAGKAGLVPAPAKGAQGKFLRGDGTWQTPPNTTYAAMKGATAGAAGTSGLVTAPAAGKQGAFLRGDGTWAAVIASASVTIPTTGWKSDSTADYPYYYDISCSGITAADRADLAVAPASVRAATACGMCPATETRSGVIRIRAEKVPTAAISANYWVIGGK